VLAGEKLEANKKSTGKSSAHRLAAEAEFALEATAAAPAPA